MSIRQTGPGLIWYCQGGQTAGRYKLVGAAMHALAEQRAYFDESVTSLIFATVLHMCHKRLAKRVVAKLNSLLDAECDSLEERHMIAKFWNTQVTEREIPRSPRDLMYWQDGALRIPRQDTAQEYLSVACPRGLEYPGISLNPESEAEE